jgi:hypothetical protein
VSETRDPRFPQPMGPEQWRATFRELELRIEALRNAVVEAEGSFNMTSEQADRIHARFTEVGEQWEAMRCSYPFGGWPGEDACRVESTVPYESAAYAPEAQAVVADGAGDEKE